MVFQKGVSGNPSGKPKEDKTVLGDMLAVYRQVESKDKPRQRQLRQWYKDNPSAFLGKLTQLSQAAKPEDKEGVQGVQGVQGDESADKLKALIDRMLQEWENWETREKAEREAK